jgi:hypothetical protein
MGMADRKQTDGLGSHRKGKYPPTPTSLRDKALVQALRVRGEPPISLLSLS